jgi:diacylglycerol kinase family enzyme
MTPGPGLVTCIVNGAAGSNRGEAEAEYLRALFRRHDLDVEVELAEGAEISAAAERAVKNGSRVVVAAGGDGTINAVAQALIGTDTVLGVLPLGTHNHFAKDLKIPLDLDAAVATVASGETAAIDVGEVNGRIFLNNSSLGLYPWIVRQRDKLTRHGIPKWRALLHALVSLLRRKPKPLRARIATLRERGGDTPILFVGNNKYHVRGARMGGREELDRGQLWIARAPGASYFKLVLMWLRALLGFRPKELHTMASRELLVETGSRRTPIATDGEVTVLKSPLHFRSRPRALKVIVPA